MKKKMIAAMLAAMCLCSAVTANVYAEENVKDIAVFEEGEQMTLDDVIELSKKGNALTWGDFVKYKGVDVGSGLYILEYVLENGYVLHVGGVPPTAAIAEAKIEYIRLSHGKKSIDIRTDDVEAFIAEIKSENDSTALRGTKTMTIDAVRELAKKGNALDWSDFAEYKGRDIGSGQNVWEFELPNGFVLYVCGVTGQKPSLIELSRDGEKGIDIRTDDLSAYIAKKEMTLDDVIALYKKGNNLEWSDFEPYAGDWHGTGMYTHVCTYDLGGGFFLLVKGNPHEEPAVVELYRNSYEEHIDIRTDDVEAFIAEIKSENDSTALRGTKTMTVDDVRELAKKGNALDWSDFAEYKRRDIGSGIYIWEFELEDGLKLDVSGLVDRKPDRIWLYRSDIKNGIDIREDSVDDFLHITAYAVMTVTVTDVSGDVMLVTSSGKSGDLFTLSRKYLDDDIEPVVGMKLEVTFSGGILETYPAQFGNVKKVTVVSDDAKQIKGDANCDGGVDMADVVFIMQSLANPDKYQLTETGRINADMDGNGVTVADAQAIQIKLLGLDKEDMQNIDSSLIANKQFVYDTENELGAYVISFSDNGSYFSIQGDFDAPRDTGTWKISGDTVVLTGQFGINRFRVTETVLTYIAEGSDGFDNVKPKDGEKFYVAYENSGKNELKASDIVSIKTPYSPAMSNWSGIGILLEVDSPDYPIFLRAADGHFTEWDIKTGSGPIKNVGNEYDAGKNGYIFWTPDEMYYEDGFNTEIIVAGVSGDVFIDFGRIYITQVEGGKFVASFEKAKKSVEPPTCAEDAGIATEGGKRVSFGLYAALRQYENTNAQIAVTPKYGTDRNYVYNGKTIQQYHNEWDEESCLGEKYGQLLKEGDKLKYGEALYTTGTPDGEKWDKDWYDTRVRFYGENFLAKYIVNGEFLRDKVLADQEEYFNGNTINYTYNMLHEAIDAYTAEMIQATIPQLEALNIRYEYREAQKELVFYVTVAEFEALSLENVSSYGLATDTMSAIAEDMGMIVYTHDD